MPSMHTSEPQKSYSPCASTKTIIVLFTMLHQFLFVKAQTKIIDMHIHSYDSSTFLHPAVDPSGNKGSLTADAHRNETFAAFKKYNIVKAVVSGSPESVNKWSTNDNSNIIIKGIAMDAPTDFGMDTAKFEQLIKDKKIEVFGEIGAYYGGTTLSDSLWQPYLRICEKYDIPVAVHTGGGPPRSTYTFAPKARLELSDPFLIEDVLVKYPKLRIYLMHSGEVWYEHALRMMLFYPQLYSDLGVLMWVHPLTQQYAVQFLKEAKEAGCLKRVMFGTDQMRWPYAIEKSINFLNNLTFLTQQDKEDILYNNAARFLRIEK